MLCGSVTGISRDVVNVSNTILSCVLGLKPFFVLEVDRVFCRLFKDLGRTRPVSNLRPREQERGLPAFSRECGGPSTCRYREGVAMGGLYVAGGQERIERQVVDGSICPGFAQREVMKPNSPLAGPG